MYPLNKSTFINKSYNSPYVVVKQLAKMIITCNSCGIYIHPDSCVQLQCSSKYQTLNSKQEKPKPKKQYMNLWKTAFEFYIYMILDLSVSYLNRFHLDFECVPLSLTLFSFCLYLAHVIYVNLLAKFIFASILRWMHFHDVCYVYYYCMNRVYRQRMSKTYIFVVFRVDLNVIGICEV